jgi:hypothetical protein
LKIFCAPVLITVYDRFDKLKKCIDSLKISELAEDTPLYIAIDYPASEQAKIGIDKVKLYANKIDGFKYVKVIERTENIGPYMNARLLMNLVFEKYDNFIRSEDDNVFSPNFLTFMNDGLMKYDNQPNVFSINAYNFPNMIQSQTNDKDVYRIKEFYPYGFASWKKKYNEVDRNMPSFFSYFGNPMNVFKFIKNCHSRVYYGLVASIFQRKTYGDYVFSYHININAMYCIVPKESLVRNEGQDGSGMNSGVVESLQYQTINLKHLNLKEDNDCFNEHLISRDVFFDKEFVSISHFKLLGAYGLMIFLRIRNIFKPYKV